MQLGYRFTVDRFSFGNHLLCGQHRGDDGNNGTSQDSAWRSLDKVNATTFAPGDKILFKAGESWNGRLWPKGSGSSGNPIIIDMYGSGSKPLIAGLRPNWKPYF